MKVPEKLIELIKSEECFTIASHENPEGDALGSSIALALALRSIEKDVRVFNKDGVPEIYSFLPRMDLVETEIERVRLKDSVLLILDCNDLERVGLKDVECKKIAVIDHHQKSEVRNQNSRSRPLLWIEPESPAAGLMVYNLLKRLELKIDRDMAVNLYTAIAVDTGTFRYENTTPETLRVAADLIDAGVNPGELSQRLYESWTVNRFRLLVSVLNTLEIWKLRAVVAITTVTLKMFKETGTDAEDTENFSSFPRMIQSVDISAMFREVEVGYWKASLRSKGRFNVAAIASYFGGGGHKNAAGYKVQGDIKEIKKMFLEAVQKSL